MPAIDPKFLKCTAYLYPSIDAAKNGERAGGTAFCVAWHLPSNERRYINYVVTNKHLIDGGCRFLRVATRDGLTIADEVPIELWTFSKDDDLAVAAIGLPEDHDVVPLGYDLFLTDECAIKGWPIFPGDEVMFFGRLVGHDGKQQNKPVMRFGNIAMLPDAETPIDFGGHQQIAFLVECRSVAGFSGAPALVHLAQSRLNYDTPFPGRMIPPAIRFLGVNCGHLPTYATARTQKAPDAPVVPDLFVESGSGVAVVIPAWRLMALLNQEHLVQQREELFNRNAIQG